MSSNNIWPRQNVSLFNYSFIRNKYTDNTTESFSASHSQMQLRKNHFNAVRYMWKTIKKRISKLSYCKGNEPRCLVTFDQDKPFPFSTTHSLETNTLTTQQSFSMSHSQRQLRLSIVKKNLKTSLLQRQCLQCPRCRCLAWWYAIGFCCTGH